MPTLRFLLFGHPKFALVQTETQELGPLGDLGKLQLNDEFNISRDLFNRIMTCALNIRDLPPGREEQTELIEAANILGGCATLEERVKQLNIAEEERNARAQDAQRRATAVSPITDTWNMFDWRIVGPQYCYVSLNHAPDYVSQGFEYAGQQQCGDNGDGVMAVMHYFRRLRENA